MRRILLAALLVMPSLGAAANVDEGIDSIKSFHWLVGCWGNGDASEGYEEVWLTPTASAMLGVSRSFKLGETWSFEYLRITMDHGAVDYVAQPGGKPPTRFGLAEVSDTRVVFENKTHDFPQRIIYQYTAPDRLDARIEGKNPKTGKMTGEDYPLRRKSCEA